MNNRFLNVAMFVCSCVVLPRAAAGTDVPVMRVSVPTAAVVAYGSRHYPSIHVSTFLMWITRYAVRLKLMSDSTLVSH